MNYQMAAENGISPRAYSDRIRLGWNPERAAAEPVNKPEFAVYRGDELVAIGTSAECAKRMGVTKRYIRWLASPAAERRLSRRKNPDKCTIGIRLDDD